MLKIAIDCDGVLRDIISQTINIYKKEYPDHIVKPITAWGLEEFFPIGKEIYKFAFQDFAKEVFLDSETYPKAVWAMRELKSLGHSTAILTYQNHYTAFWTSYWLHVNDIVYDKLEMWINDTSKQGSGKEFTPYHLFLDDSPKTLENLHRQGKKAVRMIRPWNYPIDGVESVSNMKEFVEFVNYYDNYLKEEED